MPTPTLVTVAPGHQLDAPAAASYARARAAGCPAGITSAYRSPERQAAMRSAYLVALAAYRAGRGKKPTFVAAVADSEHVTGQALDLPDEPEAWFRAHPEFGFVFTDPSERWHAAYRPARDRHQAAATTPPTIAQEDDMAQLIMRTGSPDIYLNAIALGVHQHVKTEEELRLLKGIYGETVILPARDYDVRRQLTLDVQASGK